MSCHKSRTTCILPEGGKQALGRQCRVIVVNNCYDTQRVRLFSSMHSWLAPQDVLNLRPATRQPFNLTTRLEHGSYDPLPKSRGLGGIPHGHMTTFWPLGNTTTPQLLTATLFIESCGPRDPKIEQQVCLMTATFALQRPHSVNNHLKTGREKFTAVTMCNRTLWSYVGDCL